MTASDFETLLRDEGSSDKGGRDGINAALRYSLPIGLSIAWTYYRSQTMQDKEISD
jgi:hypothetical protein